MTFTVFECIAKTSKPPAEELKLIKAKEMILLTHWWFYDYVAGEYKFDKILDERMDSAIRYFNLNRKVYVTLDIEPPALDFWQSARSQARYLYQLKAATTYMKKEAPKILSGVYGYLPVRDLHIHKYPETSEQYKDWQMLNDLINEVAIKNSEFLTPSFYTFRDDREEWRLSTIAGLKEAKRIAGKRKVYAYLWPIYHPNGNLNPKALQPIEPDFWRLQLETVSAHADGVVIYLHDVGKFDPNWPWWKVTKEYYTAKL